jgi:hypothetical protein
MNTASTIIPLDAASPGMELACDLVDAQGTVLLQQGSVLSDSLLAALERRGIAQLRVLGGPEEGEGEAVQHALQQRLEHLFRRVQGPAAAQLQAGLRAYRREGR